MSVFFYDLHHKFLSTPSARMATHLEIPLESAIIISIHALREEGDRTRPTRASSGWNFYPRPPRGGRPMEGYLKAKESLFLSTPSARRATALRTPTITTTSDFYPRPPRGGRPRRGRCSRSVMLISIHALREEGDVPRAAAGRQSGISIHALREEGDLHPAPCRGLR